MSKNRVVINHSEVAALLTSFEMSEDVKETAEKLIGDKRYKTGKKRRYTISKSLTNNARAVFNVGDNNPDAYVFEAKTGALKRLSRRKVD